jgi:hypothetical protein
MEFPGNFDEGLGGHAAHPGAGRSQGTLIDEQEVVRPFDYLAQRGKPGTARPDDGHLDFSAHKNTPLIPMEFPHDHGSLKSKAFTTERTESTEDTEENHEDSYDWVVIGLLLPFSVTSVTSVVNAFRLSGYALGSSKTTQSQSKRSKAIERGCRGKGGIKSDLTHKPWFGFKSVKIRAHQI